MPSLLIDVADAVTTDLLENLDFTGIDITRKYVQPVEIQEIGETKIVVVPFSETEEPASRGSSLNTLTIAIVVQRKFPDHESRDTDADDLMSLVDAIKAFLRRRQLTGMPSVTWQATVNDPVFASGMFHEKSIFLSVISVTYRTIV